MSKKKKIQKRPKEHKAPTEVTKQPAVTLSHNNGVYALPVKQIKTDILANILFMMFAVGTLVALKITGFGFEQLRPFLKF